MGSFFTNLKRNKIHLEIYHNGELLTTVKVSEQNRSTASSIVLDTTNSSVNYRIVKTKQEEQSDDYFNKEEFNR